MMVIPMPLMPSGHYVAKLRKQFRGSRKNTAYAEYKGHRSKPISILKHKHDELKHSQTNLTSVIESENGNVCVRDHVK
jgi:hypothetical protein